MTQGYISYIDSSGHYGFIDSPDLLLDHIFFHFSNCNKYYKHVNKGDKVNFELDLNGEKGVEAINVSFIQNASLDQLKKDFENNTLLKGFLKKIGDKYYVKDRETYIFIRLIVANYEINVKEVYEDNLNRLIDYKIITLTDKNKIRAINNSRQFLPESILLVEGNKTEGLVVATVKGGYQIKIHDNILGFLPNSFVLKNKGILELGELINVTCIKASDDLDNVVFNLTENIDTDKQLIIEKKKFISSIKPGDKFLGKILSTQGFGSFISIGLCEGLLHVNNILNENLNFSKQSRKEFAKLLEQAFSKGQEIEIIVEENVNDRLSFTWDKSLEVNEKLYQDFYAKFKLLDTNK
jgi:predicted RNA-binding protein with RPS1 domain